MGGIDDDVSVLGDWSSADPSSQDLLSSFLDDFTPPTFSDGVPDDVRAGALPEKQQDDVVVGLDEEDDALEIEISDVHFPKSNVPNAVPKPATRGTLAERMAARAGFSAPKLNTEHIGAANMASSSSDASSPYVTIPAGLSPTTLLDSPVLLSDSLGACTLDPPQSLPMEMSVHPQLPKHGSEDAALQIPQEFNVKPCFSGFSISCDKKDIVSNVTFIQNISDSVMGDELSPPLDDQQDGEGETKGDSPFAIIGAQAEDGYNWRKYGQKQVKGSEFPRSYYKCTHPNCPVKKKVERSHEGHITEIIYKGAHNHPKPPLNRRVGVPGSQQLGDMLIGRSETHASQAILDGKSTWANSQSGNMGSEWKNDGLEVTSSPAVATEFGDPSPFQVQDGCRFELDNAIDFSSTPSNDEDENDQMTLGSVSLGFDDEDDESESKRRKLDAAMEIAASRAIREPRVVVQTTSEVDILDDGYRWRKYGQKVVKGNPNPRSYYKCTNPGCTVRKHVERASHDLKSVITTYEGKHNHDVPAARNNNNATSGGPSNAGGGPASQVQSTNRMPEHTQDSLPRFDGSLPLTAFALSARDQLPTPTGFRFPMGQEGLPNFAMVGLGPPAQMKMLPSVHPYLRAPPMSDASFMVPKGEPKEEAAADSTLPIPNGASVYHQVMSRLPLGPQL
ncbi:hypothetical protein Taro_035226 [Colocasia esculenta]|uniref:WRKY domain-containing protein n=1 Tax=Colocasia esculenta TaxID=4460 RepID=A0A843W614_COLES|nr:hypothetical protein [Colocasia esculenta]